MYDILLSATPGHTTDSAPPKASIPKETNNLVQWTDDKIIAAISKAFSAVEGNHDIGGSDGPRPRKKWPSQK